MSTDRPDYRVHATDTPAERERKLRAIGDLIDQKRRERLAKLALMGLEWPSREISGWRLKVR